MLGIISYSIMQVFILNTVLPILHVVYLEGLELNGPAEQPRLISYFLKGENHFWLFYYKFTLKVRKAELIVIQTTNNILCEMTHTLWRPVG